MPKGLKPVRKRLASGDVRLYWYHRATGKRLQHAPDSAQGFAEIAGLDGEAKAVEAVSGPARGTLAALWLAYRDSPEWRGLKPRTRSDYQAVRDFIGTGAERVLVQAIRPQDILKLRDKAAKEKGRRFANYVVQVLRMVLGWSMPRGWRSDNPGAKIPLIRKPSGQAETNRAWTLAEVEAFSAGAPQQLMVMLALGLFAGMRQGDALVVTWAGYDGQALRWRAGKNGERCNAPVSGLFKRILDDAKARRGDAVQIALTSTGTAWTASGFRASFFKRLRTLREAGTINPGLTFHGLRHTVATSARDGSETEFRIAAAIGDRSTSMAALYGRGADREAAQMDVLGTVQKRFANIDWKPRMETAPKPKPKSR